MSELDPNIMRRNLPEDVHELVDQVSNNTNAAVDKLVTDFRAKANAAADDFANRKFSAELQAEIDQVKKGYQNDLDELNKLLEAANTASAAAIAAADAAGDGKLGAAVKELTGNQAALTKKLTEFRAKVDKMAETTGGLMAKAAVKTFTGGIG